MVALPPDLLAAICADPADDLPRVAAADWLEESGDSARAEFIRVQLELVRITAGPAGPVPDDSPWLQTNRRFHALRRREYEIFRRGIFSYEPGVPKGWGFRLENFGDGCCLLLRGFVAATACPWDAWAKHHTAVLAAQPVERVTLATAPSLEAEDDARSRVCAFWLLHDDGTHFGQPFRVSHHKYRDRARLPGLADEVRRNLLRLNWPRIAFALPEYGPSPLRDAYQTWWTMEQIHRARMHAIELRALPDLRPPR